MAARLTHLCLYSNHTWVNTMVITMKTVAARLKHARETHRHWSQNELAVAAGVSQSTVGNIEAGLREGRFTMPKLAKALGVSLEWLADGEGDMLPGETPSFSRAIVAEEEAPHYVDARIQVPVLANAGSMGKGNEQLAEDVPIGTITLSPEWLKKRVQPTSPQALRFIHGLGDSMSPTFEDGDILLVDTGARDARSIDGVYVLSANHRIYIKRVRQRLDGTVEVTSDNPNVKTVDILNGDHGIEVLGRVVWAWNGRKL